MWFFCLFLCSFSGFRSATSFETVPIKCKNKNRLKFAYIGFEVEFSL